jgi:hypothetical protein
MRCQNQLCPAGCPKFASGFALVACIAAVVAATLSGCSHAASVPGTATPVAAPVSTAGQPRTASAWAFIDGTELPVRLRIPFAAEWQRRETKTSLRLEHPRDNSQIIVRLWLTARLVTVDRCASELALIEPEAALARQTPMPSASDTEVSDLGEVVVEKFEPGGDFHGSVRAFVHAGDGVETTAGTVVAIAAGVGRCLALVASTSVVGANAEQQIADRLAWLVEGVTKSLSLRTVEGRVSGQP